MPKVTYHPSQFDVPAGSYRARFLGTEERPPFEGPSKWGPATQEPRLRWKFEVLDGYVKRPGTPQWLKVSSTDLQIPF